MTDADGQLRDRLRDCLQRAMAERIAREALEQLQAGLLGTPLGLQPWLQINERQTQAGHQVTR